MDRKKLIFFASSDPDANPNPAWSAYHFAQVAARSELEAEVRLAGDAVRLALPEFSPSSPRSEEVLEKARKAAVEGSFLVSFCPGCVEKHALADEDVESVGGIQRPLGDILTEVAEGRSVLIHMG